MAHHLSVTNQSLIQIKKNIDSWLPYLDQGIESIVSTASGCGIMVKDYKIVEEQNNFLVQVEVPVFEVTLIAKIREFLAKSLQYYNVV